MQRVNFKMTVEASDPDTGAVFWREGKELAGVPYADFVEVQGILLEMQAKLHDKGKANAAKKAAGK